MRRNKYQEALYDIKNNILNDKIIENEKLKKIYLLQELVDKEIPTKPLPDKILERGSYISWKCPNCKKYVSSGFYYPPLKNMADNHKRCPNCGQAIDWRNEE